MPSTLVVWTHGACSRHRFLLLLTPAACLHPGGLGPRGHPIQEHFTQRPDVIGEARRHRWRLRLPLRGRTRAVGRDRLGHGLT
jgi:hypothetical protein